MMSKQSSSATTRLKMEEDLPSKERWVWKEGVGGGLNGVGEERQEVISPKRGRALCRRHLWDCRW